ncbi:DUF3331 domain-containing protein [Paraburkholderia lacunae]|uniref:DUF3331 domain-containing protein n=1 Tax=Paraburkholderia lacunae TaxID=2211104 RepID=A0A370MXE8_9BURK|nr:DUF3331 domain-containing protein [Paraburkholderia lacunae]RDJ98051.1 hypothetical protein DLM46_34990 [Paraburkholderia lacunae]
MHVDIHTNQCTEMVRGEGQVRQGALCAPCDRADSRIDGGRMPVWDHVIRALLAGHCDEDRRGPQLARPSNGIDAYATSPRVQVEVIERLSDTAVAVHWQDATRGRYADQVWISCRARVTGRCALSGAMIRRNDLIYKPRGRGTTPANADAMILASVIKGPPSSALKGDSR